jgi:hypothetical protein
VAPVGTNAEMLVGLQLLVVAAVPLKVTELPPCVEPKLEPAIVIDTPTGPTFGESDVIDGGGNGLGI